MHKLGTYDATNCMRSRLRISPAIPIQWLKRLRMQLKWRDFVDNDPFMLCVNLLESIVQNDPAEELVTLAWRPVDARTHTDNETLALTVCDIQDAFVAVKCILFNPDYDWSEHIEPIELKKALRQIKGFDDNTGALDLSELRQCRGHQRLLLEWSLPN